MREDERDQAAGRALGGLSPEEKARFDEEAVESAELARALDEYQATVSMLESGVARERAADDLFDGVLARIEGEPSESRPPGERAPSERQRRWWPAFAGGLAVAAAAAIVLVLVLSGSDELGPVDARAAVSGTPEFSGVHGEATLRGVDEDDGVLVLDLNEVPAPAPGEHYEVWVLREGAGGEMEAVGVFSPTDSAVELDFRLPGPGDYEAVDVSVEPDGGPAEHSGRSLAGGAFEPAAP
ncbi:MAG: anti-sigma factor [Gaiellaceae bacterium]